MHYITADGFEDHYHTRNMAGDVIMTIPSELARRLKPRVADALLAEQNMRESKTRNAAIFLLVGFENRK